MAELSFFFCARGCSTWHSANVETTSTAAHRKNLLILLYIRFQFISLFCFKGIFELISTHLSYKSQYHTVAPFAGACSWIIVHGQIDMAISHFTMAAGSSGESLHIW
jgi:hypothetical protein